MKLAIAVKQVQCWLSDSSIALQYCVENYGVYLRGIFTPDIGQIQQKRHIQNIDQNLEQAFKNMMLADKRLEYIWAKYKVHDDVIELKNMIDNEHLYNRLNKELNHFMCHYARNSIESDINKSDNPSFVTHNTFIFKF